MSRRTQHIAVALSPEYMERLMLLARIARCDPRNYCREIIEGWIQSNRPRSPEQLREDLRVYSLLRSRRRDGAWPVVTRIRSTEEEGCVNGRMA